LFTDRQASVFSKCGSRPTRVNIGSRPKKELKTLAKSEVKMISPTKKLYGIYHVII
jgi:hypothetical protein